MIELQAAQISKKYSQKNIFKELSFSFREGVLGIAGANGSGKSTLMKCLAYLLRPTSGSVTWTKNGQVLKQAEFKQLAGYAAPYIGLYAELTVYENLKFLLEVGGFPAKKTDIEAIIARMQITRLQEQFYGNLSTGQQQRLKLAAALIRNPDILLLDEPGSNLDAKGHDLVKNVIEQARADGKLVILASNDPNEIILCDKVIELGKA